MKAMWQVDEAYLRARIQTTRKAMPQMDEEAIAEVEARFRHRNHASVTDQLDLWWRQAQVSFIDTCDPTGAVTWALTEDAFVEIMRKISKELLPPSEWDPLEAETFARQDWEHAANGRCTMERRTFMDAIYQLADM